MFKVKDGVAVGLITVIESDAKIDANKIKNPPIAASATANIGLGVGAISSITTGDQNIGLGEYALTAVTSGDGNIAIGGEAGYLTDEGSYNTAIGYLALRNNIDGNSNTAVGFAAMNSNTTGTLNMALGEASLNLNTTGINNVGMGFQALQRNTTGSYNTGVGHRSGRYMDTGSYNIFIGAGVYNPLFTSSSNQLNIGNWIYGANGDIGIGSRYPTEKLDVSGDTIINKHALAELITNSTFDNTDDWIIPNAQWTINSGILQFTSGSSETAKIPMTITQGKTYQVEFDVTHTGTGVARLFFWDLAVTSGTYVNFAPGEHHRFVVVASGSNSEFKMSSSGTYPCKLDNISVKELVSSNLTVTGRVSIGTATAPGSGGLLVDNDIKTNSRFGVGSGGNTSTAAIYKVSDTDTGIYWPETNTLGLTTGGSERMRIGSDGNVGIGTSNPQSRIDVGGGYMANEQGRTDHVANTMPSPHYHFDGSTGNVNLGSTAHLSNFTGGHTISAWINLSSIPTDTNVGAVIFQNYSGKGSFLSVNQFAKLHSRNHGAGASAFSGVQVLEVDRWYHVARTNDGAVTKLFINGVLDSQSNDIGEWYATNNASVGSWSGGGFKLDGDISKLNVYNIGLSEDEVKELYSGASVPFKYKGASQTDLIVSGRGDGTTTTGWSAYSSNTIAVDSGEIKITYVDSIFGANYYFATSQGNTTSNLTAVKRYRVTFDARVTGGDSAAIVRIHNGSVLFDQAITSSMTTYSIEFYALDSTNTRLIQVMGSGEVIYIDDISLTQIGAVAEYDGSSATTSTWYDKSGNDLDGTVTGATLQNKVKALEVDGSIVLNTTGDANIARGALKWSTSEGTNRSYIRVGGSYAANDLEFGTGNGSLGMILHTNAGLSLGSSYASTFAPASGLIVQGNVGIGTGDPDSKLQVGGLDDGSNYDITLGWNAIAGDSVGSKRSSLSLATLQTRVNNNDIYKWDISTITALASASGENFGSDLAILRSDRSGTLTDDVSILWDRFGNTLPGADNTQDLGSPTKRWANMYTGDMHLSNEGTEGNSVDGTTGDWTIQEGENDLFIINNKSGKKFKISLQEVE